MTPKVLIIIATNNLSGPGKGLMQFIQLAVKNGFEYVLSNFIQKNQTTFEFMEVANEKKLNFQLLPQRIWLDPSLIVKAYRLFRKENCNIIQTHGYKGHIIGFVLSKMFGIKWIGMVHGWTRENMKVRLYNKIETFLLKYPDVVITVSPKLNQTISKVRGKDKATEMILNAVDESELLSSIGGEKIRRNLGIADNTVLLGVFGRLSPEKGQHIMLQAFAKIAEKHSNIFLLIVGDGQERNNLEALATENNIKDKVIFAGYQRYMRDYYEATDIVVLPSLSEGLPNVVLEAMCLGKPVVSTDVGGVREIIESGKNGWIVEPNNVEQLARKVSEVLSNRDELNRVAASVKESIFPKFSPELRADKILAVYDKLLNQC